MHFCAFSMQIGNYRAYETILRNEISKNDQERIHNCRVRVFLGIYGFIVGMMVDLMIWSSLFFAVFVFWFMFSAILKVFRTLWDRNIHSAKSPPISGLTIYYARFSGSFVFFCQLLVRKLDYCSKKRFLSSIFLLHELLRFLHNRSTAESRLSNFGNLSLTHSWQ